MKEMANFTDFSKKQEIWSSSNNNDDFYEFDPQQKLKKLLRNPKEECIIVGEYSVEPDRFEKLQGSSKCQMPLWLTFLLAFIGIMLAITALAAILITSLAKNYASYNENCDSTRMCDTEKNLNCSNGICVCGSSSLIWISSYSKCILRKSYGENCLSTSECADLTGLFCATSPSGCNCPSTSVANMCDCQLTQYYDQTQKKCGYPIIHHVHLQNNVNWGKILHALALQFVGQ
ncbi:hypothetical protein BpHYR1_035962 [Brachionus plicatilis]|uniref:EB domain-containing protein n=1 Tax=Brachionus plicatilis TaxID=10195 RepID=A0A3M7RUP2_BRAPC|nr:hypothetical protein BpHYR1_035962 [Brachionus plicatilis]